MHELIANLAAFLPRDRAAQHVSGAPLASEGVAMIADISGFTPLTETLARELSPARGAEELTRALNSIFAPLIDEAHRYGGSVIKFGGDALIIWFPRPSRGQRNALVGRALAAAAGMQAAIAAHGLVRTPAGPFTLTMKVGMAYGPALRVRLGDATLGYEDVIGGETLDRMAEAEHHASPGEILLDPTGVPGAAQLALVREERGAYLVVSGPARPMAPARQGGAVPAGDHGLVEALRPYLPAEVFEALAEGRPQPAELKPVVSIFVQFRGIHYEDAATAEPRLASYFAAAQATAARYGGRVNRLITGDKGSLLHLIFGAPRAVEELERRAALCCLELRRAAGELGFIVGQRIGAAAGRAFAGPVGSAARRDYTVMGDAINLSARLMQGAEDGQIIVDSGLAGRLTGDFALESLGEARLKGKAEPVARFALLGQVALPPRRAARAYGRGLELAALRRQVERLVGGRGGVAVLIGGLGMGKSHLLAALRASSDVAGLAGAAGSGGAAGPVGRLGGAAGPSEEKLFHPDEAGGILWAGAAAASYGQPRSGALIAVALRELLGLDGADDPAARLGESLADLLGDRAGAAALPYLTRFLGLPLDEARARALAGLAGESLRWRIFELLAELLRAVCARQPLVIALDDLQWADPTSRELIESLLPLADELPLLLILASRPDDGSRVWPLLERVSGGAMRIELGGLDEAAALAVVGMHAGGLDAAARARLAERGQGNPLFLVELARTAAAGGDPDELPDSVQGLLLAQIDRLSGELRETLQLAAVLGPGFAPRLLAALSSPGVPLEARLEALEAAGFLLRTGEGYGFRHILIRESAYGALLYARRRGHHGAAALAIERLYPTRLAERSGELAEHYERAENLGAAARYHGQAADGARLLYANQEAEAGYRHVLELLERAGDDGLRARTYLKLAQVKMNAGDYAAAQELYDVAFGLLEREETQKPPRAGRVAPVFRMGIDEPETLDPALIETSGAEYVVRNLFEGLVDIDDELNIVPAAAHHWTIDHERLRYVFELRPGLCWSDGTELTAHDFISAWRRNLDPDTQSTLAERLFFIRGAAAYHSGLTSDPETIGARAVDAKIIEIELEQTLSFVLFLLTSPAAFPQPRHTIEKYGRNWCLSTNLVSNGAYLLKSWHPQHEMQLRRNPYYRSVEMVDVERARLKFIAPNEDWARRDMLDLCRLVDKTAYNQSNSGLLLSLNNIATYFLAFSCSNSLFKKLELRRAFAACVNQAQLVEEVWAGVQVAASGGMIPPGLLGHSPDIGITFEPETARETIKKSPDLPRITLASTIGFGRVPFFLQHTWREHLGLQVHVAQDVPIDQLLKGLQSGLYQLALMGWEAEYPDPDTFLRGLFHSASELNYFGWQRAQFDVLVDRAARSMMPTERAALYHQAERILVADEVAIVPLYYERMYGWLSSPFLPRNKSQLIRNGNPLLSRISLGFKR